MREHDVKEPQNLLSVGNGHVYLTSMSTGTFGERVERARPAQAMTLPAMQTGRHPNLLTSPPTMGPDMRYTPHRRLLGGNSVGKFMVACILS